MTRALLVLACIADTFNLPQTAQKTQKASGFALAGLRDVGNFTGALVLRLSV